MANRLLKNLLATFRQALSQRVKVRNSRSTSVGAEPPSAALRTGFDYARDGLVEAHTGTFQQSVNTYVDADRGLWFAVDVPSFNASVKVELGVLSVRGWAWSRECGAGTVRVEIADGERITEYECPHRYCRFDMSSAIAGIPLDNYAGFEMSIDRYDLPQKCTLSVTCTFSGSQIRLGGVPIEASRAAQHIELVEVGCDCCGGSDLVVVGKKDGLTIRRCKNCGLAFTSPRPSFAVIRERYSANYFENAYLPEMHKDNLFEDHRRRWNYYLDQLERFKGIANRLFEIGCGAGYLLREAQTRGWQARGLDLNPAAVAFARSLGLDADLGEISGYEFQERKFGAFVLESVLEHFLSPGAVLRKCASALHPGGGLFILTLGYEGDVFITQGMDFQYVGPSEHLFYFSNSSLCRMCEEAGLRVEHLWHDETNDGIMLVATRRFDRQRSTP